MSIIVAMMTGLTILAMGAIGMGVILFTILGLVLWSINYPDKYVNPRSK